MSARTTEDIVLGRTGAENWLGKPRFDALCDLAQTDFIVHAMLATIEQCTSARDVISTLADFAVHQSKHSRHLWKLANDTLALQPPTLVVERGVAYPPLRVVK